MKEITALYTKNTAFKILASVYPLSVRYDNDRSKYYVGYENCILTHGEKPLQAFGSGNTIDDACFNYIRYINECVLTLNSTHNSYKLIFTNAY